MNNWEDKNVSRIILMIVIVFGVLVTLVLIFNLVFNRQITVLSTEPADSSIKIPLNQKEIRIKFNQVQSEKTLKGTTINPELKGRWEFDEEGRVAIFVIEEKLQNYTTYRMNLKMKNKAGREFESELVFKTVFVEFKDLPEEQKQKSIDETDTCPKDEPDRTHCDD